MMYDFLKLKTFTRSCIFLLFITMLFSTNIYAQKSIAVKGGVIDEKTGEAIIGASVVQKGTTNGAVTDTQGNFSLNVSENDVLYVSYIGYFPQEIPVSGRTNITILMKEDVKLLDEVVVVGYGTQKRSEVTAAVSSLNEDRFNTTAASSSALELAKGKIPGLVITNSNGGDPRSGVNIQIRGVSSLRSSNSPLIVIDGIPNGDLSWIPAEDVESFSVLKDASAAAIYGTRGANGVILVTTKKAKNKGELKATFDYSGYMVHNYVYKQPEILTAEEYKAYMQSGGYNANMMVDFGSATRWPDLLIDKDNLSQVHNLAMSGGTRTTNYRASLFYREFNPIATESNNTNWGARLNVNHLGFNDRLQVQLNFTSNFRNRNHVGENDAWEQASQRNPTEPAKDENGKWLEDDAYNSWNPLARYESKEDVSKRSSWLLSSRATLTVTNDLKASVMGSWQQTQQMRSQYYLRDSKVSVNDVAGGGRAQRWAEMDVKQGLEMTLDYTKRINDIHSLNIVAGHSYEYHVFENFDAWNSGFLTDVFTYNNLGNGTGISLAGTSRANMGSSKNDDKLAAFFGRVNYSLQEKYLLSATLRYEGSSRFGKNKRWGTFPAISAGWILSKESFMNEISFVNHLKVRLGYGVTGTIPDDNYLYMTTLSTGGQYPVGNTWYQTYGPARNPNPNLKWEEKRELNFGIDYSVLKDRISGTIDIYNRKTVDLLDEYNAQLPPFVLSTLWTNVGTVSNQGFEFGLNAKVMKQSDFSWDADVTFAYQKNVLESLSDDIYKATFKEWYGLPSPGALGNAFRTEEGKAIGGFYGKRFAGFTDEGKWQFYNKNNEVVSLSEIKPEDLTYIGNGTPKYQVSLSNTFKYKGFDLTIFLRGKFDFQLLNLKELYFGNLNWLPNNVLKSATTTHAQLHDAPQYSDYYLEPGDFVKLDNLTLGYTFRLKSHQWVRNLRVYVSGQNLATFTNYKGTTPEQKDTGFDPGVEGRSFYPVTSSVMFGINLGF